MRILGIQDEYRFLTLLSSYSHIPTRRSLVVYEEQGKISRDVAETRGQVVLQPHVLFMRHGEVFSGNPPRTSSSQVVQAFLIFGYDAGVLGGVQTTKPFLDALGVNEESIARKARGRD